MPSPYYTTHCIACRTKLGERRKKVSLYREEPYSERHSWLKWKSDGSYYLCDACMGKVRELLGIEVDG